jgi:hypothetical protein
MPKRIFVYVMTHIGDPNELGCWGCHNCMGEKRSWDYETVIGVGGVQAKTDGFGGRLKWIGIGPHKTRVRVDGKLRHKVTFLHFRDFGTEGPVVQEIAPTLAEKIQKAPRGFITLSPEEQAEAEKIRQRAMKAPASPARSNGGAACDRIDAKDSCSPTVQQRSRKGCPPTP